ncbi:hypothetical protein B0H66DRAFT_596191 [Apodospora peruviana]|uniref:Gfo/Idh/MocA-like oxidoreductase N-terminal domain-containing protein n=1 Tax=Apodospora peruviana TaxID=516989 RepID=A0AAE0HSL3_9PEZI|nr:hypothetical protein B0H66DRAFT_596191 [Apodospora peruviana]
MAPIRVALIGLSCSGKSVSVDAAKNSIEHLKLFAETEAYGSADDLAADPDVDMVVCCTRVDTHYELVRPSVVVGKDAYVEWPLTRTPEEAYELTDLTKKSGSKSMVGLQGRVSPLTRKVKQLLEQGRVDKFLSSRVDAYVGVGEMGMPMGFGYFFDRKVGGNLCFHVMIIAVSTVEIMLQGLTCY